MDVFIVGVTGKIGGLLAQRLLARGDAVRGLVRREQQRAELHGQIARADVAETLAELLHEPRIGRQILELDAGSTPIRDAVEANVRRR